MVRLGTIPRWEVSQVSMFSPILNWLDEMGPWGAFIKAAIIGLIAVGTAITSFKSIAIVPRGFTGYKERNGEPVRYRRGYRGIPGDQRPYKEYHGFNLVLPWIDTMRQVDNREELRLLDVVRSAVGPQTCEIHASITIRVTDGITFLYRHSDPRMQVNVEAERLLRELASYVSEQNAVTTQAQLVTQLSTFALDYGIMIIAVTIRSLYWDGPMAQAAAQNRIADALRPVDSTS